MSRSDEQLTEQSKSNAEPQQTDRPGDEKQLSAIRYFCVNPHSGTASNRSKGGDYHNWAYLVQQISYFDFGHIQKDEAVVRVAVRQVRKELPNGPDWDRFVKAKDAHQRILSIIRSALASVT
jgi:hypothetical protein